MRKRNLKWQPMLPVLNTIDDVLNMMVALVKIETGALPDLFMLDTLRDTYLRITGGTLFCDEKVYQWSDTPFIQTEEDFILYMKKLLDLSFTLTDRKTDDQSVVLGYDNDLKETLFKKNNRVYLLREKPIRVELRESKEDSYPTWLQTFYMIPSLQMEMDKEQALDWLMDAMIMPRFTYGFDSARFGAVALSD